jgi:hypothetical protein
VKKIVKTIDMETKDLAIELLKIARAVTKLAESLSVTTPDLGGQLRVKTHTEQETLLREKKCLLCERSIEDGTKSVRGLHAYCRNLVDAAFSEEEAVAANLLLPAKNGGRPGGVVQKALKNAKLFTEKTRQPKPKRNKNDRTQ